MTFQGSVNTQLMLRPKAVKSGAKKDTRKAENVRGYDNGWWRKN